MNGTPSLTLLHEILFYSYQAKKSNDLSSIEKLKALLMKKKQVF